MKTTKSFLILVLLLLCGCSQSRYYIGQPLGEQHCVAGTELAVVLDQLGPPHRMSASTVGYMMAYEYWRIDEDKLGLSLRAAGADFLSIDWGDAQIRGEYLLLSFDKSHRLIDSELIDFDMDAGGGRGIQALVSVIDVVDVDDLTGPMYQHRWGGFALESLPVTLNRNSNLDGGQRGIEQRGTPGDIGQRATE